MKIKKENIIQVEKPCVKCGSFYRLIMLTAGNHERPLGPGKCNICGAINKEEDR